MAKLDNLNNIPDTRWWYNTLNETERNALGSVQIYRCPTRRPGGPLVTPIMSTALNGGTTNHNVDWWSQYLLGPQGDYAAVTYMPRVVSPPNGVTWGVGWGGFTNDAEQKGPLRVSRFTSGDDARNGWTPRATMAWWSDGSSNQFVLGEKHVALDKIGRCPNADNSSGGDGNTERDCTYLLGGSNQNGFMAARSVLLGPNTWDARILARPSDVSADGGPNGFRFGSWHHGICQFLLGDGSVRAVAVTAAQPVLEGFHQVDDGKVVEIP